MRRDGGTFDFWPFPGGRPIEAPEGDGSFRQRRVGGFQAQGSIFEEVGIPAW